MSSLQNIYVAHWCHSAPFSFPHPKRYAEQQVFLIKTVQTKHDDPYSKHARTMYADTTRSKSVMVTQKCPEKESVIVINVRIVHDMSVY